MSPPPTDPAAAPPPDPATTLAGTVLCIEDEPTNMALVEALLSQSPQVRLLKAFNGRDGVRLALSEQPQLVLLDMHLPDMHGLDVVRALSEPISRRGLRVVLLTADAFSIDIVKAMSLGAHAYWPKPLTIDKVRTDLQRLLQQPAKPRPGDGPAQPS